ncbi:MAG: hypothetical protein AAGL90_17495 [Pseudomonadota bacterium]
MDHIIENLDRMCGVWNTEDADEQVALTKASMEHNVHFVDPKYNIIGHDPFLAMVKATQAQVPGAVYARASKVDFQNNFCRFHWSIHLDGKLVLAGFDVVEVTDQGKILKVIGFFGELEPFGSDP